MICIDTLSTNAGSINDLLDVAGLPLRLQIISALLDFHVRLVKDLVIPGSHFLKVFDMPLARGDKLADVFVSIARISVPDALMNVRHVLVVPLY